MRIFFQLFIYFDNTFNWTRIKAIGKIVCFGKLFLIAYYLHCL